MGAGTIRVRQRLFYGPSRLRQFGDLRADGIGKRGLEHEALPLPDQVGSQRRGKVGCLIGPHPQLGGKLVGVDEPQACGGEVGRNERLCLSFLVTKSY